MCLLHFNYQLITNHWPIIHDFHFLNHSFIDVCIILIRFLYNSNKLFSLYKKYFHILLTYSLQATIKHKAHFIDITIVRDDWASFALIFAFMLIVLGLLYNFFTLNNFLAPINNINVCCKNFRCAIIHSKPCCFSLPVISGTSEAITFRRCHLQI